MRMRWSKYPQIDGKNACIIVDMDGTLVNVSGLHHLFTPLNDDGSYDTVDFDEFHRQAINCPAIWSTVDSIMDAWEFGYDVIIVTARSDKYWKETKRWLDKYFIPHNALFMRSEGDNRSDYDVKKDMLSLVRAEWNVARAYDDNPHVVKLWEEEAIPCVVVPGWVETL